MVLTNQKYKMYTKLCENIQIAIFIPTILLRNRTGVKNSYYSETIILFYYVI